MVSYYSTYFPFMSREDSGDLRYRINVSMDILPFLIYSNSQLEIYLGASALAGNVCPKNVKDELTKLISICKEISMQVSEKNIQVHPDKTIEALPAIVAVDKDTILNVETYIRWENMLNKIQEI